jgi:hypothetical protein
VQIGQPAQADVSFDQGGGDTEGFAHAPRPPSAAMRAASSETASVAVQERILNAVEAYLWVVLKSSDRRFQVTRPFKEEDPVPSGVGISAPRWLDNEISRNLVLGNRGGEEFGGGIALVTGGEPDGRSSETSGNTVRKNVDFRISRSTSVGRHRQRRPVEGARCAPPSRELCD